MKKRVKQAQRSSAKERKKRGVPEEDLEDSAEQEMIEAHKEATAHLVVLATNPREIQTREEARV